MVFARGRFLMCVLIFLNSLLYTSTVNFPGTTYPHVDNIGYHSCGSFDDNLGRHPQQTSAPRTRKLWKLEVSLGRGNTVVNVVILVITLLNIIFHQLRQLQEGSSGEEKKPPSFSSEHLCRQFSLDEMHFATSNFDQASVIGKGGFGKVYRGLIDHGATTVAVKRLDGKSKQGASEFWTEVKMLSKFRHSNLVSLIGYCDDSDEMILVYEYVSGGNLGERLHKIDGITKKSPLSWVERLKICIGAARALDYLHTGTGVRHRIIHRDVKSSNILLDEHMAAKVSDFGVSKVGPMDQTCTHVSTDVKGSFGYFDPNYFMTRRLTRKSDVYAFGVVLLEVLCGRPAIDSSLEDEEQGLVGWAQRCIRDGMLNLIIDPSLRGLTPHCLRVKEQFLPSCLKAFVQIANKCLQSRPQERPTMAEVVVGLEALLVQQESALSNIINKIRNSVHYDNQEKGHSYIRGGVDGGHHHSSCLKSYIKSAKKMTFSRMLRDMLAVKTPGHGDEKTPEKKKRNHICVLPGTLSDKDLLQIEGGDAFQEVPFSRDLIEAPTLKKLNLAGLRSATRNFSHDTVVGEGAFGKVFLGWVKQDTYAPSRVGVGMPVAVKKLNTDSFQGLEEWRAEVNILGRLRHPNLVKLLGYCFEDKELLLVYEFMAKGSLENYILKNSLEPLSWAIRLKILIGAARGLAFLHATDNQIIYRDFKSSNILLDQDFNAKLADFGLATSGPINGDAHISTQVMGTQGYAAPEYVATGHLNGKNDIYAFGVVLLETLTGLRVIDKTRPKEERNLVEWARPFLPNKKKLKAIIIDPALGHDYPTEAAFQCAALVLKCTHLEPKKRPSIEQVLQILEKISSIKIKSSKCTS